MTPVISPWVFYAMQVFDATGFIFVVLGAGGLVFYLMALVDHYDKKTEFKGKKKYGALVALCLVIAILCPTKSTLTKMIVAQNVTYERVEMVGETVQDVYEDIISLVDGDNEDTDDTEE